MKKESKKILTFLVILSLLSAIASILLINHKKIGLSPVLGIFILMWCPALSAFMVQLAFNRTLSGLGWRIGNLRWLILSYLLPAACGVLAYGFIWLSGLGSINQNFQFKFFHFAIFGLLFNFIFAAGEEIGWRGFLVPALFRITTFGRTCFISGIIWAVWHFPLIIWGLYLGDIPVAASLAQLSIVIVAMSFIINWIRLKSGSVWTAVLLHASHNLYMQMLFDPATKLNSPLAKYISGENGFALIVAYGVAAFIFWRKKLSLKKE